jgi:hypothetical protein
MATQVLRLGGARKHVFTARSHARIVSEFLYVQTPSSRVTTTAMTFQQRLQGKTGKPEQRETLSAPNTRRLESGEEEDLEERGNKVLSDAATCAEHLGLVGPVVESLSAIDEYVLEYSPAFLLRALQDAQGAHLTMPELAFVEVVRRHALTCKRDGKIPAAVSCLDPKVYVVAALWKTEAMSHSVLNFIGNTFIGSHINTKILDASRILVACLYALVC